MKTLLWSLALTTCFMTTSLSAQLQFNPQIGVNFTDVDVDLNDLIGIDPETQSKAGVIIGADMRIGQRLYLQPGLFIKGSKIVYSFNDDDYEVTRWGAKLEGHLGYKLIDEGFRLRIMAGPSYDFELGINSENNPYFDDDDFKSGIFGLDAGFGIDILFLTAELGYTWAFTETFDENFFDNEPRYETIYFTVGLVFGN